MRILQNESLQQRNTLRLQSNARAFVSVSSEDDLRSALDWATTNKARIIPFGQGSNIVLAGDLNALVIRWINWRRTPHYKVLYDYLIGHFL